MGGYFWALCSVVFNQIRGILFGRIRFALGTIFKYVLDLSLGVFGLIAGVRASASGDLSNFVLASLIVLSLLILVRSVVNLIGVASFEVKISDNAEYWRNHFISRYQGDGKGEVMDFGQQSLLYDPEVCAGLESSSNSIDVSADSYRLPLIIELFKDVLIWIAPNMKTGTFNGAKVRLRSTPGLRSDVVLQRTDYYSDRLTNNIASSIVYFGSLPVVKVMNWAVGAAGELLPLEQSPLSNQLGGSCILITADHHIAYVCQGRGSAENAKRLAPSGSGSFDWGELSRVRRADGDEVDFQEFCRREIFRELSEEVGAAVRDDDALHVLTGFGRYLYRGGKPEVFSLAISKSLFPKLHVKSSEYEFTEKVIRGHEIDDVTTADGIVNGLNSFMNWLKERDDEGREEISGPLWFACVLARQCILSNPVEFEKKLEAFWASDG